MEELVQKVEGLTTEIPTGKTLDQIYSEQARAMTPLDFESTIEKLTKTILEFVQLGDNNYYILNSKKLNYITIFNKTSNDKYFAEMIAEFLLKDEGLIVLGGLKMFTDEGNDSAIHLYIGEIHFALFVADNYVISEK